MKQSFTRLFVILVLLIFVAAIAGWYVASGKAVAVAERLIGELNSATRPNGSTAKITYGRIGRSPFPTIGVRLVDPALQLDKPTGPQGELPLHLRWQRTGTLDVTTHYLAHAYALKSEGSGHLEMTSGEQTMATDSAYSTVRMTLEAKNAEAFKRWSVLDLNGPGAVLIAALDVKRLTLDCGPLQVTDATTGTSMFAQDALQASFINRIDAQRYNFDLALLMKGSQVSPDYNRMVMQLLNARGSGTPADLEAMPFSTTRAGKQDIDLAMQVDVPKDTSGPVDNGTLHIDRLTMKNDYYTVQLPLRIDMRLSGGKRRVTITLDWMLDASAAGAAEIAQLIDQRLGAIAQPIDPVSQKPIDRLAAKQQIMAALPTLSTLGPVTLKLDFEASVPSPETLKQAEAGAAVADGSESVVIRQLVFDHKRWGIDLSGHGERTGHNPPTMDFKLICKQCELLSQDVLASGQAAQAAFNLLQPALPQALIDPAMASRVSAMLGEIGQRDADGTVTFAITTPAAGDVRINDKPYAAAMQVILRAISAPLPAPMPEAAAPTATTPSKKTSAAK